MLSVLIIDEHAVFRQGLKEIIAEDLPGTICGEAGDGEEALAQVARQPWDIVLLDISIPGGNSLEILGEIRLRRPGCPVLMLAMRPQEQSVRHFLSMGASGYMIKDRTSLEVVRAFRNVLAGKYQTSATPGQMAAAAFVNGSERLHEGLSDREFSVMLALAEGKRPTDIARDLELSIKTVSTYKRRILDKMHMTVSAELTRYAIRSGLIAS